jgi:type VI secretion system protein ImpA
VTQTTTVQLDVDALLAPAAGGTPSGPDLRYLPVYDELKTARKTAEAEPQELIPWKKLADLSAKALAQSKDLQIAIWLMEPLARVDGFRGVSAGLVILRRLLVEFWESLYPAIDPDDSEPLGFRKALLNWVDEKLPAVVRTIPLTAPLASFGLLHYDVTLKTGDEKKALLEEGWPSSERFEEALNISSLTHLESVLEEVIACEAERAALQSVVDQRFNADGRGGDPVTFSSL